MEIGIEWDESGQQFVFTYADYETYIPISDFNNISEVANKGVVFDAANFKNARLEVYTDSSLVEGDEAKMTAYFDDVYVNGLVYDDFSSDELDSTKWELK